MISLVDLTATTSTERRQQRLRDAIAQIGADIAEGTCRLSRVELQQVIELCRDYGLPLEAARVRRWMMR